MGGRDDARQLRAGPAAPADRRRPVRVLLLEVAGGVRADAEIGDRRDPRVVETQGAVVHLPVGQEAEDLATQAGRGDCRLGRHGAARGRLDEGRASCRLGGRRLGRQVDGRAGLHRCVRLGCRVRAMGAAAHGLAVQAPRRQPGWRSPAHRPLVAAAWREADGHAATRREVDAIEPMGLGLFVLDRGLEAGVLGRLLPGLVRGGRRCHPHGPVGGRDGRRQRNGRRRDQESDEGGDSRTSVSRSGAAESD